MPDSNTPPMAPSPVDSGGGQIQLGNLPPWLLAILIVVGGGGVGGGVNLLSSSLSSDQFASSVDIERIEKKMERLDTKMEALNVRLVDLRIAIARYHAATVSSPESPP